MLHKNAKTILNKHKKRDSWFLDDYSVNPYEGCSCNCLYCYIRGSKYGENMEKGLAVKDNALELLDKELSRRAKNNQYGFVAVGSATDAYIRQEEKALLTQGMLKLLLAHSFSRFHQYKKKLDPPRYRSIKADRSFGDYSCRPGGKIKKRVDPFGFYLHNERKDQPCVRARCRDLPLNDWNYCNS